MTDISNTSIPYPWQQEPWQELVSLVEQDRLPHALLLSGAEGLGKWHLANCLSAYLLCQTPASGLACGKCRSCQLRLAHSHPDEWMVKPFRLSGGDKIRKEHNRPEFHLTENTASGAQIRVEQVRLLANDISQASHQGQRKVIVMGPMEQMNTNAANALLKSLEEPTPNTFFVLISHMPSQVLATIRSRCQQMSLPAPTLEQSSGWLQSLGITVNVNGALSLAGGAPLTAKSLLEEYAQERLNLFFGALASTIDNPSEINLAPISAWKNHEPVELIGWWVSLIQMIIKGDSVHWQLSPESEASETDKSISRILKGASDSNRQWLFKLLDKLLLTRSQLLHGATLNIQLLLEDLLLDWYAILSRKAPRVA